MSDRVSVPAEKITALREAVKRYYAGESGGHHVGAAALAVVDAVEREAEALEEDRKMHAWDTSPASDDAEKPCPTCGHVCHEYCEHDAPSHMAAPDELTALRRERDEWKRRADEEHESGGKAFRELVAVIKETEAEWLKDSDALDALRERIAAVRVLLDDTTTGGLMIERAPIRAALGDA